MTTVVGARPQFIKAAPVSRALRESGHEEYLIHTGQHYNHRMSDVFFSDLGLPPADANLQVGSGPHGAQTARMLERIESVLLERRPDLVLVYGDTNSTLAGALAACKLGLPLAHVEAGLRSHNRSMPEEHNRVLADHCADLLFCPTRTAVENLAREGITAGVHLVGDTMYDAVLQFGRRARECSSVLRDLGVRPKEYLLATVHRAYNTDCLPRLHEILEALGRLGETVILPLHPRTRHRLEACSDLMASLTGRDVRLIEPLGYLDMLALEQDARVILTDSGGMQKEAFFFGVPCVTLRPETEWVETVESGWNVLAGTDAEAILRAVADERWPSDGPPRLFGEGDAADRILEVLASHAG